MLQNCYTLIVQKLKEKVVIIFRRNLKNTSHLSVYFEYLYNRYTLLKSYLIINKLPVLGKVEF